MSVIAEVLALPFTPPDQRVPLGYYPHVIQPDGPARTMDGRRPAQPTPGRPRRSQRKPRVLWTVAVFSEKPRGGGNVTMHYALCVSEKQALKVSEENSRKQNPRNFNFQSVASVVPAAMMERALEEGGRL